MSCLDVRGRLSEYVLGVLSSPESRDVERHLHWCPGCQKEAEELQEGVATVALSMAVAEPPPSLEQHVVARIKQASGKRRHGSRRGFRLLVVATLAALLLALGAVSWGVRVSNRTATERLEFDQKLGRLSELLRVSGTQQAYLTPIGSTVGQGRAVVYSSARAADLVLVDVFPARADDGPYRFKLFEGSGKAVSGGKLRSTPNGDFLFYDFSGLDLSRVASAIVFDRYNIPVLTGRFRPTQAN